MSLLIPPEIARNINKYSGHIFPKSKFGNKNLKGLFNTKENIEYLFRGLFRLITNFTYVQKNLPLPTQDYRDYQGYGIRTGFGNSDNSMIKQTVRRTIAAFVAKKDFLKDSMNDLMDMMPMPYKEDIVVTNPIQQLHNLNKEFLLKTSKNFIQSPQILDPNFYSVNPETNLDESKIEWDYNAESYSDGTWHPEHLFTNSQRNKKNVYWSPIEVNYYSNPGSKGLGHRYYSDKYSATTRTRSQFPRWQYSVDDSPFDRDNKETLREGGSSDRRTQRNRGYDMSNLVSRSTY